MIPSNPSGTPPTKKRGGHTGWFRKKPKEINRIEEVRLDKCPVCGSGGLTECKETHEHIQEDIILPKVEVALYRKHRYYCKNCKEIISPKGADEIPGSCIGPRAKAFALVLEVRHKNIGTRRKRLLPKSLQLKNSRLLNIGLYGPA